MLVVSKVSCRTFEVFFVIVSWLVKSLYFFISESILEVISNSVFDMSLFSCTKSFGCRSILSCTAKKDSTKLKFLIFPNCPLVRICDAMINRKFSMLKTYVRSTWWSKRLYNSQKNMLIVFMFTEYCDWEKNKAF